MGDLQLPASDQADFSVALRGPLYQLFLRARLTLPTAELVRRRVVAFVAVTWLPPVPLTVLSSVPLSGVSVSFLMDLDAHVRSLFYCCS
jgi:hypothetical protein